MKGHEIDEQKNEYNSLRRKYELLKVKHDAEKEKNKLKEQNDYLENHVSLLIKLLKFHSKANSVFLDQLIKRNQEVSELKKKLDIDSSDEETEEAESDDE